MSRSLVSEAISSSSFATPVEGQPGRFLIQIATPGWGASGYYSPAVLEAAAKNKIFAAGTHMYLDHEMADGSGVDERGNRSIKDLAAAFESDAVWDGQKLSAIATVFGPYRTVLDQMKESVGTSMRAWADVTTGTAEGRSGIIVNELVEAQSVDFVTRAGRGGKILQVIESARAAAQESTVNDTRNALDSALTDEYGGENQWVGVCDFDEKLVWFWKTTPDSRGLFQVEYSATDDGAVTLSGDPIEVRAKTSYVPVPGDLSESFITEAREAALVALRESRNIGQWIESRLHLSLTNIGDDMYGNGYLTREERIALSGAVGDALDAFTESLTQSANQLYSRDLWEDPGVLAAQVEEASRNVPDHPAGQPNTPKEFPMGMIQVDEAEHRRVTEAAGRVQALESERDTAVQRAETAEAERDQLRESNAKAERTTKARSIIEAQSKNKVEFNSLEVNGLIADLPVTESGALDEAAFTTAIDKEIAGVLEANGAGRVTGFGASTTTTPTGDGTAVTESALDRGHAAAFPTKTKKGD